MTQLNLPPFLADLKFAPHQHPHSIGLIVVPTLLEMRAILAECPFDEMPMPETPGGLDFTRAACCFDFNGDTQFGYLIFASESLTPAIIVHEVTHAAMFFVGLKVMTSVAVLAKSEEDQQAYYDEACAHTAELLFDQAFNALFEQPTPKIV